MSQLITGDSVYKAIDVDHHRLRMIKSATDKKGESFSVIIFLQDLLNSEVVWCPLGKEVKTSAEMGGA